jgi:hypothetical protein
VGKEIGIDDRVLPLKIPKDCEQCAKNVELRLPELAREARRRAIELRAAERNAESESGKTSIASRVQLRGSIECEESEKETCVSHLADDQAARNHLGYGKSCR